MAIVDGRCVLKRWGPAAHYR